MTPPSPAADGIPRRWLQECDRKPRDGQVWYLLGLCEQSRGNPAAALKAWERVDPSSPFAARVTS